MKTKIAFLFLLFMLMAVNMQAEDSKIIVWLNDGNKTEVLFDDMPEFVYQDGTVSLKSEKTELSWPLAKLQKFTFEAAESVTDIKSVPAQGKGKLDLAKGCAVYDLNGHLLKENVTSLSELLAGTYIVNDGSVTTKVIRR